MRSKLFILAVFFLISPNSLSYPCTVFNATKNGKRLAGNNEDNTGVNSKIRVMPASEGKYGVIYFYQNLTFPQGGMNDQGLFFDVAGCPSSQGPVIPGKPPLPWSIEHNLNLEFLQKCANVEEALELVQSYSYPFKMRTQTMFVDKTGASAIIGWINGEFKVTRKKGAYQIMTNFSVSNPELGNFPCLRYEIASNLLNKSDVSIKSFRNILSAVHHEGRVRTVYSNIYDLNQGLIYVYNHHDFENVVVIDMEDELKKGEHVIDFVSIFPKTFVGSLYTKELEFESPSNKLIILGLIFFAAILFSVEGFTKWAIKKYHSEELTALKVNWSDIIIKTWVLISAVLGGVVV